MPHGDDPHGPAGDAIEEAVWGDNDLAIRKLGELGKDAPRLGESLQPAQRGFGSLLEPPAGGGIVTNDVRYDVKELPAPG